MLGYGNKGRVETDTDINMRLLRRDTGAETEMRIDTKTERKIDADGEPDVDRDRVDPVGVEGPRIYDSLKIGHEIFFIRIHSVFEKNLPEIALAGVEDGRMTRGEEGEVEGDEERR